MTKFKLGDRVKINDGGEAVIATIITANVLDDEYELEYKTTTRDWFRERDLKLVNEQPKPEKTADEMFEELGYEKNTYSARSQCRYEKSYYSTNFVLFDTFYKDILLGDGLLMTVKLHKAIHKKLEELGWL